MVLSPLQQSAFPQECQDTLDSFPPCVALPGSNDVISGTALHPHTQHVYIHDREEAVRNVWHCILHVHVHVCIRIGLAKKDIHTRVYMSYCSVHVHTHMHVNVAFTWRCIIASLCCRPIALILSALCPA